MAISPSSLLTPASPSPGKSQVCGKVKLAEPRLNPRVLCSNVSGAVIEIVFFYYCIFCTYLLGVRVYTEKYVTYFSK